MRDQGTAVVSGINVPREVSNQTAASREHVWSVMRRQAGVAATRGGVKAWLDQINWIYNAVR